MLILVGAMLFLSMTGNVTISYFNESAFLALMAAFLVVKDKKEFENIIIKSLMNETLVIIVLAFILAGVLSQLLRQSGLVNGLVWIIIRLHIDLRFMPFITFVISILMSAFCGTTNGAITTVTPILLPLAVVYGAKPEVVLGAIMSGCILGHGLVPTCDTSIISAMTQESDVRSVTLTRLPYVVSGGILAGILFLYMGWKEKVIYPLTAGDGAGPGWSLTMLLIPLVLIILIMKGHKLITTLFVCNLIAVILNLFCGLIDIRVMFSAEGPLCAGISGMRDIIVFCLLLFSVLGIVEAGGMFDRLANSMISLCHSRRSAEFVIAAITLFGCVAIGGDVPVIAAVGPFVRKMGKTFQISETRTANIMDMLGTAGCGLLPYNPGFLIGIEMAIASGAVSNAFSYRDVIPYCYYSMAAVLLILISVLVKNRHSKKKRNEVFQCG